MVYVVSSRLASLHSESLSEWGVGVGQVLPIGLHVGEGIIVNFKKKTLISAPERQKRANL